MDTYIVPMLIFIALFVGFGLTHRGRHASGGCVGCTGEDCSGKSECSKEDKSRQH